jgi:lipid-A-disaccharide synthase-like uncharacterized protein
MDPRFWLAIGFLGQFFFSMRFLVQWMASERRKKSTVPILFWYCSLAGGSLLLTYAIFRLDPVFIVGQAGGLLIYIRNLVLIRRQSRLATVAGVGETGPGGTET